MMHAPLDLLPLALLGLATIVGVAVVLVASDLLRRFVLFGISLLLPAEPARDSREGLRGLASDEAPEERRTPMPR